jgi:hypothetical protein
MKGTKARDAQVNAAFITGINVVIDSVVFVWSNQPAEATAWAFNSG